MPMDLHELSAQLQIPEIQITQFARDFNIENSALLDGQFEKFAGEQRDFLNRYLADLAEEKSPEQIAETIHRPKDEVLKALASHPEVFENGIFKSSVSSFAIDRQLGGDYHFIYDFFGAKTPLVQYGFIGYRDLYAYISDAVEPFLNDEQRSEWGISRPAGIILYGPPGSGKIFWGKQIAKLIGYEFSGVKKHYFGTSYVEADHRLFDEYLLNMMKKEKVLLFMEDFDDIMRESTPEKLNPAENEQTKEIVLHYMGKFEEENVLMVGAAEKISGIDPEILAPGRFDITVPVFPPNAAERAEMILYHLTSDLSEDAMLLQILKKNKADELPFWKETAARMRVFSNTMIVDFTQIVKKKIRNLYRDKKSTDITISPKMLDTAFRDSAVKLTADYFDKVARFLHDVSLFSYDDFAQRADALRAELDTFRAPQQPGRVIGFKPNEPADGGAAH